MVRLSSFASDKILKGLPQGAAWFQVTAMVMYTTENNGSCYVKTEVFWRKLVGCCNSVGRLSFCGDIDVL